jgi:hypothetical protein
MVFFYSTIEKSVRMVEKVAGWAGYDLWINCQHYNPKTEKFVTYERSSCGKVLYLGRLCFTVNKQKK